MKYFREIFKDRPEISVRYDTEDSAVWFYLNPTDRPRLSMELVKSSLEMQKAIVAYFEHSTVQEQYPIQFLVVASQTENIFNYGGDLSYFIELINRKDREELYVYTQLCVENVFLFGTNLGVPLQTITLMQGNALGGGLELALSCSSILAEKSCKIGFPESRFNLFPGVGAYTLLSRAVGINSTEEIIKSGKLYSAQEFYEKGIVTELVEDGKGIDAVKMYMKKYKRNFKTQMALSQARDIHSPLHYDELMKIAELWMDIIFKLDERDIRSMNRLVNAQNNKDINEVNTLRTYQDRRIVMENVSMNRRKVDSRRSA